jgi:phosphoribosylglycinamide formyltransferase-1
MTLGVLASGRGSNLQALLDAANVGRITSNVSVVISDVESAFALDRARGAGVPAVFVDPGRPGPRLTPTAARTAVSVLREHGVEWVVLAGFMRIVGKTFFHAYPDRILNIHPSLLPAFRGLHAQRQALEAGVQVAGCTVHIVTPELDAGPILKQASVRVEPGDTEDTLSARILVEEHEILVETVRMLERERPPQPTDRVQGVAR